MRTSFIAVAGLGAVALASPDQIEKRQFSINPSLSSILAQISSLEAKILPPSSIAAELTGVPASVTAALGNPSAISALESEILASGFPSWYTALPSEAQSYVLAAPGVYQSIYPQIVSLEIAAGLTTVSGLGGTGTNPGGPIQTVSGGSNSTRNSTTSRSGTTGSAATTSAPSSTTATTSGLGGVSSTSRSSSAGVAPTNAPLAAGVMGAVAFLGLALAL